MTYELVIVGGVVQRRSVNQKNSGVEELCFETEGGSGRGEETSFLGFFCDTEFTFR